MPTTFIYALKEPETGEIRYVGKSDNPKKRLACHLRCRERCYRTNWIKTIAERGLSPLLEIIDEVPVTEWQAWEVAYIEFFRDEGCLLVNGTAGGDGLNNPTEETREKIRAANSGEKNPHFGKPLSSEHRAKVSAGLMGREISLECRAKLRAARIGKKLSLEHRKKLSIAKLGIKFTLETREKMSIAQRTRLAALKIKKESLWL